MHFKHSAYAFCAHSTDYVEGSKNPPSEAAYAKIACVCIALGIFHFDICDKCNRRFEREREIYLNQLKNDGAAAAAEHDEERKRK